MRLMFTRRDGKFDLLEVTRADGSVERIDCPKQGIIPHEMVHYAVESVLGARGFMRALSAGEASGYACMGDVEAESVERLVETMQADAWGSPGSPSDLLDLYLLTCAARKHEAMSVDTTTVQAISDEIVRLTLLWDAVPVGGSMELSFQP